MSKPAAHPAAAPRLRLRITTTAESIVRSGHPWLFADSIHESNRPGETGELAVIFDRKDKFLAIGLYDADSPIRVRVLHVGKPETIDAAWWQARLTQTLARRAGLFDATTTGYRLIHGESDGWPGLVLDKYDSTLVLKLYTAAWLPRLAEILAVLKENVAGERMVLRLSRNIQAAAEKQFQLRDGQVLFGVPPEGPVIFSENGVRFEAEVLRGQKTGFFLDQRENRQEVGLLASGKRVLNAFSFSGGFSVYAARGGATNVTDLDISAHALESAKRNFALNQNFPAVAACRHETVQADAFEWIEKAPAKFDLVVLDPPSLAKRAVEREGAIRAYERVNGLGIKLLAREGILVAGSCSAHVPAAEFFDAVRRAAVKSGRKFFELKTKLHPPDHPAGFKEAEYLKVIYLKFST
ncbi:MAG TPA: class I SAM-dependent methyltransferase [Candidatus Acidoferrales bacterium]|jgi:23S rRNA (cytosine1962-C5)-methyltransferase|nr:class I SAM-dependent methyltransferase [Candidatus Acidoferrales bacterium]